MNTLIQADIFFFITSIAVAILTILLVIAFIYFIQILINFRAISDILRGGTENAKESIEALSASLAKNPFIKMIFGRKIKNKKKK
ncbi:MAG: hypothetical protein UU24_C0018G0005 [Candidatus Nomurabacteria bacterium GW2011_GWA2_40_9]|uniref:Uncharacterized protein n=1 Tax=Candidatus Nomurabacteria bacterium GW2011_GWA2_40_9 TaxID=1618734 RepID=A0A0G0TPV8_9BACT|nr:MAG: hypothetical protein UU24_C0018G0005 [Candidatus Nomurabacteria bacterium GW2011_GWA2_40_9]